MYAGMIASSFMLGRFLTAYQWGRMADHYGRVCVLQVALLFSIVFSILFGTSKSLATALIWRTALGMSKNNRRQSIGERNRTERYWSENNGIVIGAQLACSFWRLAFSPNR
jgi:MFS family permease